MSELKSRWSKQTPERTNTNPANKPGAPPAVKPGTPPPPPPKEAAAVVVPPYSRPQAVPPRKKTRGSARAKKGKGSMLRTFSIPRELADRMLAFVRDHDANASAWVSQLIEADLRARGY